MEIFSAPADAVSMKSKKSDVLLSPEMRPERVGPRVTAMREALGLEKAQFADAVGLDRSALTRIEKGEEGLSVAKAVVIADLYDFGLNYIYRANLNDTPISLRSKLLHRLNSSRSPADDLPGEGAP